ncbi:MAG: hypothetical protein J6A77_12475, partial [Lachnospiraceae bacterium]|nr:hypothetical protein [Lachnospiraceae bacterium]
DLVLVGLGDLLVGDALAELLDDAILLEVGEAALLVLLDLLLAGISVITEPVLSLFNGLLDLLKVV